MGSFILGVESLGIAGESVPKDHWEMVYPTTTEWKTLSSQLGKDEFQVDADYYYVGVSKDEGIGSRE